MIKKFIFLLFIVVVIFTFLSCTTLKEEPTSNDSTLSKLNDYIE